MNLTDDSPLPDIDQDSEESAAAAATVTSDPGETRTTEPDEETLWQRFRKSPKYAGQIGRDIQRERARLQAELREQTRKELLAEAEQRKAIIEQQEHEHQMTDAEYGRYRRQHDAEATYRQEIYKQAYDTAANTAAKTVHNQWIARLVGNLPEPEQKALLSEDYPDEDAFLSAAIKRRGHMELSIDLQTEIQNIRKEQETALKALEERILAGERQAKPAQRVISGTPGGASRSRLPSDIRELRKLSHEDYSRIRDELIDALP